VFVGQQVSRHQVVEQSEFMQAEVGEKDLEKNIAITGVEEVEHDGMTAIIGTATNNGKNAARGIHIQANLFNHDKFVDQYNAAQVAPLRGIEIYKSKSIRLRKLHEAGLAAQQSVLCQQRGIDAGNGVVHRLVHAGLSLLLTPSGGVLAERFRRVANAQVQGLCAPCR
jgi:hypothetical protein